MLISILSSPHNKWQTVLEQYKIDDDDIGSAPDFIHHYFPKSSGCLPDSFTTQSRNRRAQPQVKSNPPDIDCFLHHG
jgi:hypothetical protein